jgi:hypothetical protein
VRPRWVLVAAFALFAGVATAFVLAGPTGEERPTREAAVPASEPPGTTRKTSSDPPSGTTAPKPAAPSVIREDFDRDDGAWPVEVISGRRREYDRGGYRVSLGGNEILATEMPFDEETSALSIEVTVRELRRGRRQELYGVSCGLGAEAYLLGIDASTRSYAIYTFEGDVLRELAQERFPSAIRSGSAPNRLRAVCELDAPGQGLYSLSVNGRRVGFATDVTGEPFGGFALHVESLRGGTDVVFDDLVVRVP